MAQSFDSIKIYEQTVNLRKISWAARRNKRTAQTFTLLARFIRKQFKSGDRVNFSPEVVAYIKSKGKLEVPNKIRIKIERKVSEENTEETVFCVSLVLASSFKGLKSLAVSE